MNPLELLKARAEASASLLEEPETLSRFKELLAFPGRFTADMEACAQRIARAEKAVREKSVTALGGLTAGLTDDMRGTCWSAPFGGVLRCDLGDKCF